MKKISRREFLSGLAAGIVTVALTGTDRIASAKESEQELDTLRLAVMINSFDHYTAEIGLREGIFEAYGIGLETTQYVAGINTIDAVVNGTADVGNMATYAAVNRLGNTQKETNLILISELGGSSSSTSSQNGGLYVAPEYAENLDALDGSIGFIAQIGTFSEYVTSLVIQYLGFEEDAQTIIPTDSNQTTLALVQNGQASAVYANGSLGTRVEEYGWVLVVTTDELDVINGSYFLTTREFNAENAELLSRFLLAVQESFDYIKDNLDECGDYLEETIGVEKEDFISNWGSMISKLGFSEEGAVQLEEMEEWCYQHGNFDTEFNPRDFINVDAATLAFPEKVTVELS